MAHDRNSPGAKHEDAAVTNFREYLRVKSVQPSPDYDSAVTFFKRMAAEVGLGFEVLEMVAGKPIVIMTWEGKDPSLPSILLNSHIDVVPVFPEHWKYDPFAAVKDEQGRIYARGSQDMKCVGIQYVEAIRRLKNSGKQFLRTIYVSFVPDEEIGGVDGMGKYVEHQHFRDLNVGFGLDEGLASPTDAFQVFYAERKVNWVEVTCTGNPGHGSRFIKDTAAEKMRKIINTFLDFRAQEEARLESNSDLKLADVTSCNLTILKGGVQANVVPDKLTAVFDFRVTPELGMEAFERLLDKWCSEAGTGVSYTFLQRGFEETPTSIDRNDTWFGAFTSATDKLGLKLDTQISSVGTDIRFIRSKGLPALGFSPMNNTPILLHDHNEYLDESVFLRGIAIYEEILTALANVPKGE